MADPMIRIALERIRFTPTARGKGLGQGKFTASITAGKTSTNFGDSTTTFDYRTNPAISLNWSTDVNVKDVETVTMTLICKDTAGAALGSFTYRLTWPWRSFKNEILATDDLFLVWSVSLTGQQREAQISFATLARQHDGSVKYGSISASKEFRLEICPVLPVPADAHLPKRPDHIRVAANYVRNDSSHAVRASDPINVIPNPPLIPLLKDPPAKPTGTAAELDEADWANQRNAARIEYTFYWPDTERFAEKDERLEWKMISGAGEVAFLKVNPRDEKGSENHGLKVLVYGKKAGEVVLGVHFNGVVAAKYRAVVGPVKKIPCRFQILNGPAGPAADPTAYTPLSTPEQVFMHREIANRFLRQVGVALVPEKPQPKGAGLKDGATATTIPGVFRIRVAPGQTRNVSDPTSEDLIGLNSKVGVLNFLYIHSGDSPSTGGAAIFWPNSKLGAAATVQDSGSPSSSWINPSGIKLDPDAATVTMKLIQGIPPGAGKANIHGMFIANAMSAKPGSEEGAMEYGVAIAHEVGHMLNLGHRVEQISDAALKAQWDAGTLVPAAGGGIAQLAAGNGKLGASDGTWCDDLWHPRFQNVMRWLATAEFNQDFDILQLLVVQQSPILDAAI